MKEQLKKEWHHSAGGSVHWSWSHAEQSVSQPISKRQLRAAHMHARTVGW